MTNHPTTHQNFLSAFWATFRYIFQDRGVFLLLVIAPILYGAYYPWPYSTEAVTATPVGVVDYDNNSLSRQIIRFSAASPRLDLSVYPNENAAKEAMWSGQIAGFMVVPQQMKHDVVMRLPTSVSIVGNGGYLLMSKSALYGFAEAVGTVSAGIELRQFTAEGASMAQANSWRDPVPLVVVPQFNTTEGYGSYVVPGVAILILQQTLLVAAALLVGTWMETHTTNASPWVWAGRVFALSFVSAIVCLYYFGWVFEWQSYERGGNRLGSLLLIMIFTPTIASLGCLLGLWFKQRERAMQVLIFSSLPLFFLSGYPWPVEAMPTVLSIIRWLSPGTPAIQAAIRFNQLGASIESVALYLLVLAVMGVVSFTMLCWLSKRIKV